MTLKRLLIIGLIIVLIVAAPIAWWLISPLFITRTVNEDFPAAQAAQPSPSPDAMIDEDASPSPDALMEEAASPSPMAQEPTPTPSASAAPSEPVAVKTGEFHSVEHHGSGTATIYQLPDGKHVLRLENFEVLNGPDLYVWLSAAPDANDEATILNNEYIELGRLKGNEGNQNYELPAGVDPSAFNSVTIWCRQFSVNFATAPLQ